MGGPASNPGLTQSFGGTARYRVLRELGAGASGVVFAVEDLVANREVALKTLPWPGGEDIYWLKQEFRAIADVIHPNLVTLYELEVEGDRCFFTMEKLDGVHFDVAVRRRGGAHVAEELDGFRALLRQLVAGLHCLHQRGRLHRDVKPSNVMVTEEGRVVLLDFGLMTSLEGKHQDHNALVVGTLAYSSPEQGLGRPIGTAADWYSCGVMLYEALAGEKPFEGSFFDNIADRQAGRFVPIRTRAPEVPEDLARLVEDLLSPRPEDRPHAAEILRRIGLSTDVLGGGVGGGLVDRGPMGLFVGRDAERGALERALAASRPGRGVLVRVHGPAGIGKTALLQRFVEGLPAGRLALFGRCHPRESVPFVGLDGIVDGLSRRVLAMPDAARSTLTLADLGTLAAVFPVFRAVHSVGEAGPADRGRTFAALARVLDGVADGQPVVLWVDDLQWSDPDSVAALRYLLEVCHSAVLLLVSYPSSERTSDAVVDLVEAAMGTPTVSVRSLPVGPLDAAALSSLADVLTGAGWDAEQRDVLVQLATAAGGSPLAVAELVRAGERPGGLAGVQTVQDALRMRIDVLPPAERRLLEVVAVAGRPLAPGVARAAALVGETARPEVALEAAALLRPLKVGDEVLLVVYHNMVRTVVLDGIDLARLRRHHHHLAQVIRALAPNTSAEMLAHIEGAGEGPDAGPYAAFAAREAMDAGAFELAASLYGRAGRLSGTHPDRWRWMSARASNLAAAGRGAVAARAWLEAVGMLSAVNPLAPEIADMRREAASELLRAGRWAAGIQLMRDVLDELGVSMPATTPGVVRSLLLHRARLWVRGLHFTPRPPESWDPTVVRRVDACWAAAAGLAWVQPARATLFHARFAREALNLGDPVRGCRALASEAAVLSAVGGATPRSTDAMERCRALLKNIDDPLTHTIVAIAEATLHYFGGAYPAAQRWVVRAEAILEADVPGGGWELTSSQVLSSWSLAWMGDLHALRRRLPALLRAARDRGDLLASATLSSGAPTLAWLADDRPDLVLQHLDQSMALWTHERGFHSQHWMNLLARSNLELYQGERQRAWARVDGTWDRMARSGLLRLQQTRLEALWLRGRTALAATEDDDSEALLARASKDAAALRTQGAPWSLALAEHLSAGVALAQGRTSDAQDALVRAVDAADAHELCLLREVYALRLGMLEGNPARMADARRWMDRQGVVDVAALVQVIGAGLRWPPAT